MDRRAFLQIAAAGLAAWSQPLQALAPQPSPAGIPTRLLGTTGVRVFCSGKYELFKNTHEFDRTWPNPQWMG